MAAAPAARRGFSLFAFTMASAVLFHQLQFAVWQDRPLQSHHTVPTLLAAWLLLRPESVARYVALAVSQVAGWAIDLPQMTNHWMLIGIVHIAVLGSTAVTCLRRGEGLPTAEEAYRRWAPFLRTVVLLLYGLATVAKLNAGFFDPRLSCAVEIFGDFRDTLPLPLPDPAGVAGPLIWATVLLEGALVLLLLGRRTRLVGVAVGTSFHLMLAVAGHVPFAGFAIAFYTLFLPTAVVRALPSSPGWARRLIDRRSSPAVAAAAAALVVLALDRVPFFARAFDKALVVGFVAYGVTFLLVVAAAARRSTRVEVDEGVRPDRMSPVLAVGLVLVVVNASMPYVGLKTHTSFAMYSNLQTEGGQWNHYVVPSAVQVFGFQDDVVTVVESTTPAVPAGRWVATELQRRTSRHNQASLTYERDGRLVTASPVADDPFLAQPPPVVPRTLFWFRPVGAPGRPACAH